MPFSIDKSFGTRSDDGERAFDEKIDHIYVAFYAKENGSILGQPEAVVKGEVENSSKLTFYLPSELQEKKDYKLLAIANADYYKPDGVDNFETYLKSTDYSDLRLYKSACITSTSVSGVPMQATDETFSFEKTASGYSVTKKESLLFYRMVARVDVNNSAEDIVIEGIAMCNWRDAVYFDENSTNDGHILGQITDENVTYVDVDEKDGSGKQSLNGTLYCFPSVVETSTRGDDSTTALIIKATYKGDSSPSYYRVNLGVNEGRSELKRNTRYSLNITAVKGRGFPSAKYAYEATTDTYTEVTYEPEIPDAPVALIPLKPEHINNIDHENKVIEIDGFDPDCFNSFIDIPLRVQIKESCGRNYIQCAGGETGLSWPLEGRLSTTPSGDYCYCPESFTLGTVCNKETLESVENSELYSPAPLPCENEDILYLSIGAMAPDDPEIIRTINITSYNASGTANYYEYTIKIKPRKAIIDDVILKDSNGVCWLIADRNIQHSSANYKNNYNYTTISTLLTRNSQGIRDQAYHYCGWQSMNIPLKYDNASNLFNESRHSLYCGEIVAYSEVNKILNSSSPKVNYNSRETWLNNYIYGEGMTKTSPFYEAGNIEKWVFPQKKILELCKDKMKVSKMRMFLVSEVAVKDGGDYIPVCCYWPYSGSAMRDTSKSTRGYYYSISETETDSYSMMLIYCDVIDVKSSTPDNIKNYSGLSRLVRPLKEEELTDYKNYYLGYSIKHNQTFCHPDTYSPSGWYLF